MKNLLNNIIDITLRIIIGLFLLVIIVTILGISSVPDTATSEEQIEKRHNSAMTSWDSLLYSPEYSENQHLVMYHPFDSKDYPLSTYSLYYEYKKGKLFLVYPLDNPYYEYKKGKLFRHDYNDALYKDVEIIDHGKEQYIWDMYHLCGQWWIIWGINHALVNITYIYIE